mmetsp:Transcript_10280/g.39961  ORF Transcript_10280/g.39961 Transcript_10280/m.39961 type:complete len:331 (+) Transcript_10280:1225-2217(+)
MPGMRSATDTASPDATRTGHRAIAVAQTAKFQAPSTSATHTQATAAAVGPPTAGAQPAEGHTASPAFTVPTGSAPRPLLRRSSPAAPAQPSSLGRPDSAPEEAMARRPESMRLRLSVPNRRAPTARQLAQTWVAVRRRNAAHCRSGLSSRGARANEPATIPTSVTAVSWLASLALMSAALCSRAKCWARTTRTHPAATPHTALRALATHRHAKKARLESTALAEGVRSGSPRPAYQPAMSGASSSMVRATSLEMSATSLKNLGLASTLAAAAQEKASPVARLAPSLRTHVRVDDSTDLLASPTPSPCSTARMVKIPRRYEHRAWRVSMLW